MFGLATQAAFSSNNTYFAMHISPVLANIRFETPAMEEYFLNSVKQMQEEKEKKQQERLFRLTERYKQLKDSGDNKEIEKFVKKYAKFSAYKEMMQKVDSAYDLQHNSDTDSYYNMFKDGIGSFYSLVMDAITSVAPKFPSVSAQETAGNQYHSKNTPSQEDILTAAEYCDKAQTLAKTGRKEEAVTLHKTAFGLNPYDARNLLFMGLTLLDLERYQEAADCLLESVLLTNYFLRNKPISKYSSEYAIPRIKLAEAYIGIDRLGQKGNLHEDDILDLLSSVFKVRDLNDSDWQMAVKTRFAYDFYHRNHLLEPTSDDVYTDDVNFPRQYKLVTKDITYELTFNREGKIGSMQRVQQELMSQQGGGEPNYFTGDESLNQDGGQWVNYASNNHSNYASRY